ncbi:hypothetical protein TWF281_007328 [Arthrobotrys megalospora]
MIHEIPQESVRRLGSTQVITDPITVIKELIENALDAGATSIIVEASSDLVSHIQVKDNGSGIDPNDRNLMAKPHCTSKISTFDDLLDVTTLGFRGEALASLANVSGVLTITTRIKDEAMAVACEIAPDGSLKTISPVSAPIGCTIKVTNLFAKFPVRKSTLEKTATKYLGQIKPLLLSYYLTHPQTRFQFKCVAAPQGNKGKKKVETKYDFIFAASSTKEQAVIKAFGAESSRHGQWIDSNEESDVHIEAFVVKPDADTNPVAKKGVCIAYKNRPLSITRNRGLAHSIYSLYKKQIKNVFAARSVDGPTEPLLFLNILSSVGKVDVNIEPAKDDVLFESNERVLSCIKECFGCVYGITEGTEAARNLGADDGRPLTVASGRIGGIREDFSSEVTNDSVVSSDTRVHETPRRARPSTTEVYETEGRLSTENRSCVPCSSPPIKISSSAVDAQNEILLGGDQSGLEEEEENNLRPGRWGARNGPGSTKQKGSGWTFSMYGSGIDEDEDEEFVDIEETLKDSERRQAAREENTHGDQSISNPWTISKMNSRVSQHEKQTNISQTASPTTGNTTVSITPCPRLSQAGRRESQSNSPKATNGTEIIKPSTVPTINTSNPGAPIARMSEPNGPWYPRFGSDNSTSSPNRRQDGSTLRKSPEIGNGSSSPTRQERAGFPSTRKSVPKSAGPIDTWVAVNRTASAAQTSASTEDEDESDTICTRLPISAFFGTPDLGPSSRVGDGGRGIFPSASDRMRRERRAPNPQIDEEEDVSSFSEDEEPIQPNNKTPKKASQSMTKVSASANRSKPIKLRPTPDFFNRPFKPPTKESEYLKDNDKGGSATRQMKLLVTTLPSIDLRSLHFRARLVEDDLYDDDYDTREVCLDSSELKKPFFCFLRKYVAGVDYSDETELELVQEDILEGKEFDVKFRNLAGG